MNREDLLNRLADIKKQKEQAIANFNALAGAEQEVNYWLTQIPITPEELGKAIGADSIEIINEEN